MKVEVETKKDWKKALMLMEVGDTIDGDGAVEKGKVVHHIQNIQKATKQERRYTCRDKDKFEKMKGGEQWFAVRTK